MNGIDLSAHQETTPDLTGPDSKIDGRRARARSLRERFEEKVSRSPGCWTWTGSYHSQGYGQVYVGETPSGNPRPEKAHRVAYELYVGPIPSGCDIDHVCHNADPACISGTACLHRRCVNPAHLEAVTHRVNMRRGQTQAAANARKTHCLRGHEFSESNTRLYRGTRYCRTCRRERQQEEAV